MHKEVMGPRRPLGVVLTVCLMILGGPRASAQPAPGGTTTASPASPAPTAPSAAAAGTPSRPLPPSAASPATMMAEPAPVVLLVPPPKPEPSVTDKWWFWAAIGGAVVLTATVILVGTRGTDVPKTKLGDMEAKFK